MGLPIPKGTSDKIITILGAVVMVTGIVASFATGQGDVAIASIASGAGMIVKGMEEFLGGNMSAAVSDVVAGVETIKAAEPAAKEEAVAISKDPVPTAVAAAETVAAVIDEKKVG